MGIGPVHSFKVRAALLDGTSYHILGAGLPEHLRLVFDTERKVPETGTKPGHLFWNLLAKTPSAVGSLERRTLVESPKVWRDWLGVFVARGRVMASLQVTRDRDPFSNLLMREEDIWMVSGGGKPLTLHHIRDETPPLPRYISSTAADVLFQVVNDRYLRRRPMVLTTNKPVEEWGRVLHDPDLAEAILDRVLERGPVLSFKGPSYRTRHLASSGVAKVSGKASPELRGPTSGMKGSAWVRFEC